MQKTKVKKFVLSCFVVISTIKINRQAQLSYLSNQCYIDFLKYPMLLLILKILTFLCHHIPQIITYKMRNVCFLHHIPHFINQLSYPKSEISNGSFLILLPVKLKIALQSAGATGGKPGSPTPVGSSLFCMICTSVLGVSLIRKGVNK